MSCTCGHAPEEHRNEVGECEVEGCLCAAYEEEDDDPFFTGEVNRGNLPIEEDE